MICRIPAQGYGSEGIYKRSGQGQTAQYEAHGSDWDMGHGRLHAPLAILGPAPPMVAPAAGALHHPAAGHPRKALVRRRCGHDFPCAVTPTARLLGQRLAGVARIRPDEPDGRALGLDRGPDGPGPLTVVSVGGRGHEGPEPPCRVDRAVPCAPGDPLAAVTPPGLDGLAVPDGRRGCGCTVARPAHLAAQHVPHAFPRAVLSPWAEVRVRRGLGSTSWGMDDFPQVHAVGATAGVGGGQERGPQRPRGIGEVGAAGRAGHDRSRGSEGPTTASGCPDPGPDAKSGTL